MQALNFFLLEEIKKLKCLNQILKIKTPHPNKILQKNNQKIPKRKTEEKYHAVNTENTENFLDTDP